MFAVDTNILLYGVDRTAPEHEKALQFIEKSMKNRVPWFATWNVIYEFLRVSTHRSVFPKPLTIRSALEFVSILLQNANFSILNEGENHFEVVDQLSSKYPRVSANLIHDFHTAVILYEHGIRTFYTADTELLAV